MSSSVIIPIRKHVDQPNLMQESRGGCVDLYTTEDIILGKGDFAILSLGVSMELPAGYDALLFSRSSTFKKWGLLLANGVGYIDNSYRGDGDIWGAPFYATKDILIPRGTRLCQFRLIEQQPQIEFNYVDHLLSDDRSGFGSSGD